MSRVLPGRLPHRLLAPAPGWTTAANIVVVGSGVAGLTAALSARAAGSVLLVTKDVLAAGSTRWAQGGVAAAWSSEDTPDQHLADTLTAGVGLCDLDAVRVLVTEGPAAVRRLIALGARFDRRSDGTIALTREGGHRRDRILHAGGDATGAEVMRTLVAAVSSEPGIEVIEHALVLDLLRDGGGRAAGVTLHVLGEGRRDGVGAVIAPAVVLATGGMGQVFASTTNPDVSTGDGVALALRAGAVVRDLEFVQFHPTVFWRGPGAHGTQPLVSEAVRGEGARLVDGDDQRIMAGVHPLEDLAPRDVVAKAITRRMRETGTDHVFLDARGFGGERWRTRFPTILASCREHGVDPVTELIPVAPAAHYASGGVRTDLSGRTSIAGLYACGEVACSGVHGANRLASNSLLEGLVFAERIAADLETDRAVSAAPVNHGSGPESGFAGLLSAVTVPELQRAMTEGSGVLRSDTSLDGTAKQLAALLDETSTDPAVETWEATNLATVALALVGAARERTETRGAHWREDHPERDDDRWCGHLETVLDAAGQLRQSFAPEPSCR